MPNRPPLLPYTLFEADPIDLPVRQRGDQGGPDYVVTALVVTEDEHGVELAGTTNSGKSVRIMVHIVAPGMTCIRLSDDSSDPNRLTLARDMSHMAVLVTLEKAEGHVNLISDQVQVHIAFDPFHITYFDADGRTLLDQNYTDTDTIDRLCTLPFGYTEIDGKRVAFHDSFTVEPDEHFYGFGEKFSDFDKRGQRLEMWHYDAYGVHSERAYKNVPFFVSTRSYGVFVDSTSAIQFDMASSNHSTFSLIVPDNTLDYYVITGPDLKSVISSYANLVSLPTLPPKWAFGTWISSGFLPDDTEAVVARARQIRDHDIPCDVLHLDCYWQKHGSWSDNQWDTDLFPDPAHLIEQLHAMKFKVCLWINPYVGIESPLLDSAIAKGYFLKRPDGNPWIGDLWGGDGHFHPEVAIIDMTNPEAANWFQGLLRPSLEMGIDVFKTDFGEGVPAETIAHNGMTGEKLHNLYPLIYNDLVAELTEEVTGRPGLVWGRSTYAGGQRHAAQWGGDPNCTYQGMASTMRGGLSLAMCGHGFWSHDIGSHRDPSPDLFARWAQFGLFSPLARAHGMSSRLPWDYGENALNIFRDYAQLRYRLLPYIYTYACIAHQTGLPIIRPMVLEFPDDPNTYTMDLQYMFGAELLVAPIYNVEGQRPVYLPSGDWIDFWTHEVCTGPQTRFVDTPLDVMPLFVKVNALLPTVDPPDYWMDEPFDLVVFDAYLLDTASFDLQDKDGTTHVSAAVRSGILDIQVDGSKSSLGLRLLQLPGAASVASVRVNENLLNQLDTVEFRLDAPAGWARDGNGTVRVMVNLEQSA